MKKIISLTFLVAMLVLSACFTAFGAEVESTKPSTVLPPVAESTPQSTERDPLASGGGILSSGTPSIKISDSISPAIDIIAANTPMARSGLVGREISFSGEFFARVMNLRRVESVTFVSVPDSADGVILLGNTTVTQGQTVVGANLDILTFKSASDKAGIATFELSVNESPYSIACVLYTLDKLNANPTVDMTAETMLSLGGYVNTALFGKLGAYDPEGDALTFEIVDAPDNGLLILTDRAAGEYTYIPSKNYTGRDSFSYVVCDKYGNYSSSAKVSLSINTPSTSVFYTDMVGDRACCAAIAMTENGIMGGTEVSGSCYFYPEEQISRVDFLVMAMKSANIGSLPSYTETGFFDDSDISASARSYVAAAHRLGYVEGREDANGHLCFYPNEKLTLAEAALIVDRIIDGKSHLNGGSLDLPTLADFSSVPEWARESVSVLARLGIVTETNGKINASTVMNKGETAIMLDLMMRVIDK